MVDFAKMMTPEFKAAAAAKRAQREAEQQLHDRKTRMAVMALQDHDAHASLSPEERRFANNVQSLTGMGRILSQKQEDWLFALVKRVKPDWDSELTRPKQERAEIIERDGQIAVVMVDPSVAPWERNRVAEMIDYADSDCWQVVDIRLKAHPQLSPYGCSTGADVYHASITPETPEEAAVVRGILREYREDPDGSIHWCTFDGIVRGHESVDGYKPVRYLNFDQSGYFCRDEARNKLLEIKKFWDAHEGSVMDARMHNPLAQLSESQVQFEITVMRMGVLRDQRVAGLAGLEKRAGVEYTLWELGTKAQKAAAGESVDWYAVERDVVAESMLAHEQPREAVLDALMAYSPARRGRDHERQSIVEMIDKVLAEHEAQRENDVSSSPEAGL